MEKRGSWLVRFENAQFTLTGWLVLPHNRGSFLLKAASTPVIPDRTSGCGSESLRNRLLFFLAVAVCLLPVVVVRYVPLVDLPGHLGRLYILYHYAGNPVFQQHYEVVSRPLPNMLIDLYSPLQALLRMEDVGRLFIITSILLYSAGCALLSRTLYGLITPFAVLAVFSQYNSMFFYGYAQFQSGVGLCFITLALWMRWRGHFSAARLVALAVLSFLTYLGHLGGYAFVGLSTIFLILLDYARSRRLDLSALGGLAVMGGPVLLYLFAHGPRGDATSLSWGPLYLKFSHLFIHVLGYNWMVDGGVAATLIVAAVISIRRGRVHVHREFGPLATFFGLLYIVFPYFIGDGPDAYSRVLVAALVITLLSIRIDLPKQTGRLVFAMALIALLVRIGYTGWAWRQQDRFVADNIRVFDVIPKGARVFPIVPSAPLRFTFGPNQAKMERPAAHILSWAVIRRGAVTPSTFALKGQHPVFERSGKWSSSYESSEPSSIDWDWVFHNFDFVWYYGSDEAFFRHLRPHCDRIATQGKATLFRIVKTD